MLSDAFLARLDNLCLAVKGRASGGAGGVRRSRQTGSSAEFSDWRILYLSAHSVTVRFSGALNTLQAFDTTPISRRISFVSLFLCCFDWLFCFFFVSFLAVFLSIHPLFPLSNSFFEFVFIIAVIR